MAKVGDYIQIVDGWMDTTNGKTYAVSKVDHDGIFIIDDVGDEQFMFPREYEYLIESPAKTDEISIKFTSDSSALEASLDRIIAKLERVAELSSKLNIGVEAA
jgi:hypothetical protein